MTLRTRSPGILLACTFLLTIMAPDARGAPHDAANVWQAFRGALPYHAQLVAMTDPDEEDRRILVISEPPPSLDPDAVLDILGDPVIEARAARHKIGYDGWVEDWVITLGPIEGVGPAREIGATAPRHVRDHLQGRRRAPTPRGRDVRL